MPKHDAGKLSKTGRAAEKALENKKKTRAELVGDIIGIVGHPKPNGRYSFRMKRVTAAEAEKWRAS